MQQEIETRGSVRPWGAGYAACHANGTILRRSFKTEQDAQTWLNGYEANPDAYRLFYYPTSTPWGEDYDEKRGMKRIFGTSRSDVLQHAIRHMGLITYSIDNFFDSEDKRVWDET